MKTLTNPAVTSFGATTIIFMVWLAPLASAVHETFFTMPGVVYRVVVPLFIVFFLTWLFWFLLLFFTRRHHLVNRIVWVVLGVVLLREMLEAYYALRPTRYVFKMQGLPSTTVNIVFVIAMIALIAIILVLQHKKSHIVHRIKWFTMVVLAFVAISGAFTLLQISCYTWQTRNLNTPRPFHKLVASSTPPAHHIVWILMDELSYNQVYGHRFPGLLMPAFDSLAKEATVFTDVRPEGHLTLRVVPALLSGVADTNIRMSAAGTPLSVKVAKTGKWQLFNPQQTVFQDAVNDGYNTALAGWVFPYCRLLHAQLDRCLVANSSRLVADAYTTQSIASNLKALLLEPLTNRASQLRLIPKSSAPLPFTPPVIYREIADASAAYLNDPAIDFVYIHLNTPHPLGFYDRRTGKFSVGTGKTYIDNLALCDKYLGQFRQQLEANGTWNNTTLVIMGDHSWRTYGWSKDPNWTKEENIASDGGKFDDRPGYIVKLAGQTTPAKINVPYPAIRTRSLFDALLKNQIQTPQQLAAWVGQPPAK